MTTAPQDHQAPKSEIDAKKQLTFNEVENEFTNVLTTIPNTFD